MSQPSYRGRLAPSPTGRLHLGHARTFWTAYERAVEAHGTLVLRNEDLDRDRAQAQFVSAFIEDLHWLGITWQEGPDVGGPYGPYSQSERHSHYTALLTKLKQSGRIFPCTCSRRDIAQAARAPHAGEDELIYPGTCRTRIVDELPNQVAWRFQVPDGEVIQFIDGRMGPQTFVAGRDFGDFVIWRADDTPSYQLACVADDFAMGITEVVRGADLLVSTARQLLLYRALHWVPPNFYHCPLVTDANGARLAKRHDGLSLATLRAQAQKPEAIRSSG